MTPDEALGQIRRAGSCFVIFDGATGEVLEVQPAIRASEPSTLVATMGTASQRHGSVTGRFFDGTEVTHAMLEDVVREARMVAGRLAMFSRWAVMPPAELLHVLETDAFAPPMDDVHGPSMVIGRLFEYAPAVLRPLVPRLEQTAQRFAGAAAHRASTGVDQARAERGAMRPGVSRCRVPSRPKWGLAVGAAQVFEHARAAVAAAARLERSPHDDLEPLVPS